VAKFLVISPERCAECGIRNSICTERLYQTIFRCHSSVPGRFVTPGIYTATDSINCAHRAAERNFATIRPSAAVRATSTALIAPGNFFDTTEAWKDSMREVESGLDQKVCADFGSLIAYPACLSPTVGNNKPTPAEPREREMTWA
jgi:hypothetical protein